MVLLLVHDFPEKKNDLSETTHFPLIILFLNLFVLHVIDLIVSDNSM